jgi:hypothetical protein
VVVADIETGGVTCVGEQALGARRVVDRRRWLPEEFENVRDDAVVSREKPSVSAWLMALRSMARFTAWRTATTSKTKSRSRSIK